MPGVEVLIPYRPDGCAHRARAWEWVRARHEASYPHYPVIAAPGPDGPWVKAQAVADAAAAARSSADVVVVADADVWTQGIHRAVHAVYDGAQWAIPHDHVHRLTQAATEQLLADPGGVDAWQLQTLERVYRGVAGGGIVVLPRQTLLKVPLDRRFTGWGSEDQAWAAALTCLHGVPWRGPAPLVHLYHPPQPRLNRKVGSNDSHQLLRRYLTARRNPDQMRALLNEQRTANSEPGPCLLPT